MATTQQGGTQQAMPMSTPSIFLIRMVLFLVIVAGVAAMVSEPLVRAFGGNVVINAVIVGVLVLGAIYCVIRVVSLWPEAHWVNTFRKGDPGLSVPRKTALLAPMAAMLKDRSGPVALSATSTRVILDSIGARLDESRETTRYVGNLLIFLGILGTFWGLLQSTAGIQDALDGLTAAGGDAEAALQNLQNGLAQPLSGMDTAFSSSLFGIAGSLILGFLGLQAAQAQNRFYNEFEEWLSTLTYIAGTGLGETEGGFAATPELLMALNSSASQIETLRQTVERGEESRASMEQWLTQTAQSFADLDQVIRSQRELMGGLVALAKEQGVRQEERAREAHHVLREIAQSTKAFAETGGGGGAVVQTADGATVNMGGIERQLSQLVSLAQSSDDRVGRTLLSLREIAARLLQYAERERPEEMLAALHQLNDQTGRLVGAAPAAPAQAAGPASAQAQAAAPVASVDPALLRGLNERLDRLVARSEQDSEDGKASVAALRNLDKTTARLLATAEALGSPGAAAAPVRGEASRGAGLPGGADGLRDMRASLQELVNHAKGSSEREMLEALRSINQIAHSLRESVEEGRSELLKELRAEMKILTKTIAALIIENRRNDGAARGRG